MRENKSLVPGHDADDNLPRLLSKAVVEDVFRRVQKMGTGVGWTQVRAVAWWRGELRWARNRVSLASDRRDFRIEITRAFDSGTSYSWVSRLDDDALRHAVADAELSVEIHTRKAPKYPRLTVSSPPLPRPDTAIWSEESYNLAIEQRARLAQSLSDGAESKTLLSAGYMELRASEESGYSFGSTQGDAKTFRDFDISNAVVRPPEGGDVLDGGRSYIRHTQAQCSMTVRHPKGQGSGWAGLSGYDWSKIDSQALAERALQKCIASLNPVRIEPGRYTVILEPQAVALMAQYLLSSMDRGWAERGHGPWRLEFDSALGGWRTKLGLKVLDERITITHDPMHPNLGVIPFDGLKPVVRFENGVLKNLVYDRDYALSALGENLGEDPRPSFIMHGGNTSLDEMIATTKRGVLVTRFAMPRLLHEDSILLTGLTRDGLWLVENGKISKSINNMRFTDSPLFVFNQVEQIGPAVPVFHPVNDGIAPWIVPSMKSVDFSFTATIDAI